MGNLIVSVFGAATSLLTAFLLFLIERHTGYSLYTFNVWFVLPLGAMGAGALAAGGYYLGAVLCHQRPSGFLFLNMVGVSVLTFFFIHYLGYANGVVDGQPVRGLVSFPEYLDYVTRSASLRIGVRGKHDMGGTGELGRWGYAFAGLQIAGFACGGLCVYGYLLRLPYCKDCSLYYSKLLKQSRYTADESAFTVLPASVDHFLAAKQLAEAVQIHASSGHPGAGRGRQFLSTLDVRVCDGCDCRWARFQAYRLADGGWVEISDWEFDRFLDLPDSDETNDGWDSQDEEIVPLKRV